jgi:NADPH:quinone reductase-like Zn-dependent oxidoreductase
MKAIVYTEYGPSEVLKVMDVETPTPADHEVLIKVKATSVTTGDVNARGFTFVPPGFGFLPRLMFGWNKPKNPILGMEFAGTIESVGKDVQLYKKGDQVFGISESDYGTYAEYTCRPEKSTMEIMPTNLSFKEASAIPFGGLTALIFLRDKGKIRSEQKVLINGASGSPGTYAVQLARYYGAKVTGVCSTKNLELVQSIGAQRVVDYTKEDVTQLGETYDLIFDTVNNIPFSIYKTMLSQNGIFLSVAGGLRELRQMLTTSLLSSKKVKMGPALGKRADLTFLKELAEKQVIKPVIDCIYPLDQMAEAHRYVDKGHKRGNVVITVGQSDQTI